MDDTALRVAARFLSARADAGLAKFQQLTRRSEKELALLPRLFKTYDSQKNGYRTQNLEKAKATQLKILTKLKAIYDYHTAAVRFIDAFNSHYEPTTDFKRRLYADDFSTWFGKYVKALKALKEDLRDDAYLMLGYDLRGGYVAPGQNSLIDLHNAAASIPLLWDELTRPDPDPVNVPVGGSNTARFLAFLTPSVRRLAKAVAAKLKKNPGAARPLVWLLLEDVNASSASSIAEGLLHHDSAEEVDVARKLVPAIARELDFGVVQAGVFAVALLEEVGDAALAKRLTTALAKEFAPHTTGA